MFFPIFQLSRRLLLRAAALPHFPLLAVISLGKNNGEPGSQSNHESVVDAQGDGVALAKMTRNQPIHAPLGFGITMYPSRGTLPSRKKG